MNFSLILDSVRSGLGHASARMSRFTKLRVRWLHSRGKAVSAYAPTLQLFRARHGSIRWIPVFGLGTDHTSSATN